jgi:hypothetical protein
MSNPVNVEIRCSQNKDGTYNAGVFLNGQQMADFPVVTGDCNTMRDLWDRVRDYFPEDVEIKINGPCEDCFPN